MINTTTLYRHMQNGLHYVGMMYGNKTHIMLITSDINQADQYSNLVLNILQGA